MLRIGLFHSYELHGSGSNEYTRYLARALVRGGHQVHILARDKHYRDLDMVDRFIDWTTEDPQIKTPGDPVRCTLHYLPFGEIYPVYVTDKNRGDHALAFSALGDEQLEHYHQSTLQALSRALNHQPLDILHVNHLVYGPTIALEAAASINLPVIIYPHGSSIEYTVKKDQRFFDYARDAVSQARGLIIGNEEVRGRIAGLYPELREELYRKSTLVGVGVDTSLFQSVPETQRAPTMIWTFYMFQRETSIWMVMVQPLCVPQQRLRLP